MTEHVIPGIGSKGGAGQHHAGSAKAETLKYTLQMLDTWHQSSSTAQSPAVESPWTRAKRKARAARIPK